MRTAEARNDVRAAARRAQARPRRSRHLLARTFVCVTDVSRVLFGVLIWRVLYASDVFMQLANVARLAVRSGMVLVLVSCFDVANGRVARQTTFRFARKCVLCSASLCFE